MPRRRELNYRAQLSPFERGRIVGMRECGASFREIAVTIRRSVSTVVAAWRAWTEEGRTQRVVGSGARRRTTPREDRLLRILAIRNRLRSTRSVGDAWFAAVGRPIRLRTVYHRLNAMGLNI
ncbi:hypothetical protein ABEB36_003775 [Hypothenemus hampei]|uniref:Transposase IS30-like HTH domain-containing protein n=1 Tax=Hypothenemus hampei TaxID=57062 RepID=A0ABD1F142_HYPHA